MAARADLIGDAGESAPAHWEAPFGTSDVHIVLSVLAPDTARLDRALARERAALQQTPGVTVIWQQEVRQLPGGRTSFGFRDGISHPRIEGIVTPGAATAQAPVKAGEFLLGYPDETGNVSHVPQPEVLGRNGTYLAVRKIHTKVAAWRQFLRANSRGPDDEALLAAKMVGRWPSVAPLTLSPDRDDPALGTDPAPLGNIMRARKEVYRRSSMQRHKLNRQPRTEPEDGDTGRW